MGNPNNPPRVDHNQVKRLLKQNVKHITIAEIVGCSRERIRQLDLKYFGKTGRERQDERGIQKMLSIAPPENSFTRAAKSKGFKVAPVLTTVGASPVNVYVNGWFCRILSSTIHTCGNKNGRIYHGIRHCDVSADFYIHQSSLGFVILPADKQPFTSTSVSLRPPNGNRGGAYSKRHDWRSYLNAWELLRKTKMKILSPVKKEVIYAYSGTAFAPIAAKLATLPKDLALPIDCQDLAEAKSLQQWIYTRFNRPTMYGSKWQAVRKKLTVYISRAGSSQKVEEQR